MSENKYKNVRPFFLTLKLHFVPPYRGEMHFFLDVALALSNDLIHISEVLF